MGEGRRGGTKWCLERGECSASKESLKAFELRKEGQESSTRTHDEEVACPLPTPQFSTFRMVQPLSHPLRYPADLSPLQNLTLQSVTAVILIDSDSNRLLAKYFEPAHQDPKLAPQFKHPFQTLKEQRAFEAGIFEKTRRATGPFPLHVHPPFQLAAS